MTIFCWWGVIPGRCRREQTGLGTHLLGVIPPLICSLEEKHGCPDAVGEGIICWRMGLHLSADIKRSCRRLVRCQELLECHRQFLHPLRNLVRAQELLNAIERQIQHHACIGDLLGLESGPQAFQFHLLLLQGRSELGLESILRYSRGGGRGGGSYCWSRFPSSTPFQAIIFRKSVEESSGGGGVEVVTPVWGTNC